MVSNENDLSILINKAELIPDTIRDHEANIIIIKMTKWKICNV
jgi:hypothetical protein